MSRNRKIFKIIGKKYRKFSKFLTCTLKKQIIWLLRTFFITNRRRVGVNAGFVLPTVAMVIIVVVLLTTAILFRSFERSKNASNVRVNQVVLNAAAPAIDRARAKLDALSTDPTLPRATPTDNALYNALQNDTYRLGDETRLKLGYDIDNNGIIDNPTSSTLLENNETLKSAWKFALDTNNNGLKDSYTIYGIYFRNPTRDTTTGNFNRKRIPLETRIPPTISQQCGNASGFTSIVGNSSWYHLSSGNLGKSFFVYTLNVPITQAEYTGLSNKTGYEAYKGNQSFSALEFQQDRSLVPLANNAAWFDNDMEITPGPQLLLNGRIHTNGNLLVGGGSTITLRQVSSIYSCFYNQENGQINVGGNVGTGNVYQSTDQNAVTVDLYQGIKNAITSDQISSTNKSTNSSGGSQIGFNDAAYRQRIATMQSSALSLCTNCGTATNGMTLKAAVAATSAYPTAIKNNVASLVNDTDDINTANKALLGQLQIYLQDRTRRVPFVEIPDVTGAAATSGFINFTTNIYPQSSWSNPLTSSNQFTGATSVSVTPTQLQATYPTLQKQQGVQNKLGDRILIGNNLPAQWLLNGQYVGAQGNQLITDSSNNAVNWTLPTTSPQQRWRNTQVETLADLGIYDRNGFWEQQASLNPTNPLDNVGGVRIITGAGIYVDDSPGVVTNPVSTPFYLRSANSFLPTLSAPIVGDVWPDTMPMSSSSSDPVKAALKGDLLMRATAVYHYNISNGTNQTPIACVSSYYDPTNATTAKNKFALSQYDVGYGVDNVNGKSNNGVVYDFPGRSTFTTYKTLLQRQAKLKFPNGNLVNPLLATALTNVGGATIVPDTGLQLADYSAIDTALCAISILNPTTTPSTSLTNKPPIGAIKEASLLDGREVKQVNAINGSNSTNNYQFNGANATNNYNLDLEQRRPIEIRVTDIDLGKLASTTINSSNDYLLPYSGIIYASRDDSVADTSNANPLLSPTDFILDPTRRPNGIRLINGQTLARNPSVNRNSYSVREKGLILISNVPAYIKGQFNLHSTNTTAVTDINTTPQIEEFLETEPSTDFYARKTPNNDFACRIGRNGCNLATTGDYWRPATVIADSMTLLSSNFLDGFRSDADYDLNNNAGLPIAGTTDASSNIISTNYDQYNRTYVASLDPVTKSRLKNGFWENSFVPNASWVASGTIFPQTPAGSYLLNGVTPIQRRVNSYPLYIMEICRQDLVSQCQPSNWVVGFDIDGDTQLSNVPKVYGSYTFTEQSITTNQLGQAILAAGGSASTISGSWDSSFGTGNKSIRQRLGAGDTGNSALISADQRYPRRVAFARDTSNKLISTASSNTYQPMGVGCPLDTTNTDPTKNGCTYSASPQQGRHYGVPNSSALWFRTTNSSNDPTAIANATYSNVNSLFYLLPIDANNDGSPDLDGQPLLVPVLQIHDASNVPPTSLRGNISPQSDFKDKWLQQVTANTAFNVTFVVGNSPSRSSENSAGLHNFVRFLQNWNSSITAKISGSFIQVKRSAYATAPFTAIFNSVAQSSPTPTSNLSLFNYSYTTYPIQNGDRNLPFYIAPVRTWGFDVALLSEQPDLFAQRFTAPPTGRPNEFFREVSRDDTWVQTLLCAGQASNLTGIATTGTSVTYSAAVSPEYRPSNCLTIPNN